MKPRTLICPKCDIDSGIYIGGKTQPWRCPKCDTKYMNNW